MMRKHLRRFSTAMMRLSESKRERALILPSESIFAVFDSKGTAKKRSVQYSKVMILNIVSFSFKKMKQVPGTCFN